MTVVYKLEVISDDIFKLLILFIKPNMAALLILKFDG